jgi:hypothetical protein
MKKCAVLYNNENFEETYITFKNIIINNCEEEPTWSFFDKVQDAIWESTSKGIGNYKIDACRLYNEIYNITDTARERLIELLNNKGVVFLSRWMKCMNVISDVLRNDCSPFVSDSVLDHKSLTVLLKFL